MDTTLEIVVLTVSGTDRAEQLYQDAGGER